MPSCESGFSSSGSQSQSSTRRRMTWTVVRNPARAPRPPGAEVRRASDYGAADEMRAALHGADTLFLMPAAEASNRVRRHTTAIDAAVAAGVRRIVYLSFFGASADNTSTLGRDQRHSEQHIRATQLRWTFLRMNLYMDFHPVDGAGRRVHQRARPQRGGSPRSCATTSPPRRPRS